MGKERLTNTDIIKKFVDVVDIMICDSYKHENKNNFRKDFINEILDCNSILNKGVSVEERNKLKAELETEHRSSELLKRLIDYRFFFFFKQTKKE
jgi:hypothetical protein